MRLRTRFLYAVAAVLAVVQCGRAEVKLPSVLVDHGVLQRNVPIHIWGSAAPSEKITVTFHGNSRTVTADEVGLWSAFLPPVEAGGPFELTVQGSNTITLHDILVGDVWVDSGQSNMEFHLRDVNKSEAEIATATNSRIRFFHVNRKVSDLQLADVSGKWEVCTPDTAANFSAVSYLFGRELQSKLDVPIGLVDSSWGGTPVEAWMSLRALSSSAQFMPAFAHWAQMIDEYPVKKLRREKQIKDWQDACDKAKAEGKPAPSFPWANNDENSWMPSGLYNGMISPLTKFPIKGAIWYQGESNTDSDQAPLYGPLFQAMIRDWRRAWGVGEFPFLFVQLANWRTSNQWPEVRDAQLQTLALGHTGMAVTIDIGDPVDIHPRDKQDVGRRLALAARAIGYGENIEYSGPIYRTSAREDGAIRVWFDHVGGGLVAKGEPLKGFSIAGADRRFVPADARIDGGTVVVTSPGVASPLYVRYAWGDNPDCGLYNAENLPASPFRISE